MGPIDYSAAFGGANPAQSFAQSFQLGAGIQEQQLAMQQRQLAMQQAEAKAAAERAMQEELSTLAADPSPQRIAAMSIKYPQLSENFKRSYDMLAPEAREAKLAATVPIYSAAMNGKPEIAADLLTQQADALQNSGKDQEAAQTRSFAEMFRKQPEAARETAGLLLARAMGPEKFVETFGKLGAERRAEEMQPIAVREAQAKATREEIAAANAPELARLDVQAKTFVNVVAELKAQEETLRAQYAPQRVKLEVDKLGADLGLTQAQIGQARAAAAASRASAAASGETARAARATAERERIGLLPPDKRMEAEAKLRAEYSKETKNFQDVRESFRRIESSEDTPAGDISLIFGFMKMLDPASVVREGEFATAQNAAGIPTRVTNAYNKAMTGKRLDPKQIIEFRSQAAALYKAAKTQDTVVRQGLSQVATGYGLDTKNIFFEQPKTPPSPAAATGGKPPTKAEVDAALNKYLPPKPAAK